MVIGMIVLAKNVYVAVESEPLFVAREPAHSHEALSREVVRMRRIPRFSGRQSLVI